MSIVKILRVDPKCPVISTNESIHKYLLGKPQVILSINFPDNSDLVEIHNSLKFMHPELVLEFIGECCIACYYENQLSSSYFFRKPKEEFNNKVCEYVNMFSSPPIPGEVKVQRIAPEYGLAVVNELIKIRRYVRYTTFYGMFTLYCYC